MTPASGARAIRAELVVHKAADSSLREEAGQRAQRKLSDVEQPFASKLRTIPRTGHGAREA